MILRFTCEACGAKGEAAFVPRKDIREGMKAWIVRCLPIVRMAHIKFDPRCKAFDGVTVAYKKLQ